MTRKPIPFGHIFPLLLQLLSVVFVADVHWRLCIAFVQLQRHRTTAHIPIIAVEIGH